MVTDIVLFVLIVAAFIFGIRSHRATYTPYVASIIFGFLLAAVLHRYVGQLLASRHITDLAFGSIVAYALLVVFGAIIFYGCLIAFYHVNEDKALNYYSKFSMLNFITVPVIVLLGTCMLLLLVSEAPSSISISSVSEQINNSWAVRTFSNTVQRAGIDVDTIKKLDTVHLSHTEEAENVVPLDFKSSTISYDQSLEYKMKDLVNEQRQKNSIAPLDYDIELANVAREHSIDMLKQRYFAHINLSGKTPFDRLHDAGINYAIAGENLAISTSLDSAIKALMASPTHRANILNEKFHKTGIGIGINQDGVMAITEEFSN